LKTIDIETPVGLARAQVRPRDDPRAALILGHGAGGGVSAPDLLAAARGAEAAGFRVVLVEQPYRVAGRRSPAPARQLDVAWTAVVEQLRQHEAAGLPLVLGGRSSGARVACRTAEPLDAVGVLCLAFPLHPPGRPDAPSRIAELDAVPCSTLVIQGERDPFGIPPPGPRRAVELVKGDHGLKADVDAVEAAARDWLAKRRST
jgi:uncharacterized protein